jgi:23S rRNA (uracil1939-C5)-methyltransferase
MVYFVPGTAPRERVRVRVVDRKPRFAVAELLEILEPSPARRKAPCPVADRCGGCSWQHVLYSEQAVQKQGIVTASLRGLQKYGPFEILPFLAAEQEFEYRNRIQVHVEGERVGFFAKGSNQLVETRHCLVSEPALNARLKTLKGAELNGKRRVELAIDGNSGQVALRLERDPHTALFGQIHRQQNEVLKSRVVESIPSQPAWVMDLYAGAGNLTFPLWQGLRPEKMIAVELSRESVERGRKRELQLREGSSAPLDAIEWHAGDVAKVLARQKPLEGKGCVVLDPPRIGCEPQVIAEILKAGPQQIVYVSCNPATLARDLERLLQAGKYRLESVQGLDMFPQTEHVELIASLRISLRAAT